MLFLCVFLSFAKALVFWKVSLVFSKKARGLTSLRPSFVNAIAQTARCCAVCKKSETSSRLL